MQTDMIWTFIELSMRTESERKRKHLMVKNIMTDVKKTDDSITIFAPKMCTFQ